MAPAVYQIAGARRDGTRDASHACNHMGVSLLGATLLGAILFATARAEPRSDTDRDTWVLGQSRSVSVLKVPR